MELQNILQHLFQKSSLEEVPLSALQELVNQYPYFAAAQFLLAKKTEQESNERFLRQVQKANLYFHDPLWLHFILRNKQTKKDMSSPPVEEAIVVTGADPRPEEAGQNQPWPAKEVIEHQDAGQPAEEITDELIESKQEEVADEADDLQSEGKTTSSAEDTSLPAPEKNREELLKITGTDAELSFDPYHTIDYFASLGIKLSPEIKPDDKLGRQLKSFTEWLKSMRRLPEAVIETGAEESQDMRDARNQHIEKIAAHSLVEKEIVTEAMADVLVKQGKKEKAAGLYRKLSLLNPDKSAYFAAKIDDLNLH